jgi:hypothetical protein
VILPQQAPRTGDSLPLALKSFDLRLQLDNAFRAVGNEFVGFGKLLFESRWCSIHKRA